MRAKLSKFIHLLLASARARPVYVLECMRAGVWPHLQLQPSKPGVAQRSGVRRWCAPICSLKHRIAPNFGRPCIMDAQQSAAAAAASRESSTSGDRVASASVVVVMTGRLDGASRAQPATADCWSFLRLRGRTHVPGAKMRWYGFRMGVRRRSR